MEHVISPHGGALVDLVVAPPRAAELRRQATEWPSWDLSARQRCDLELLATGAFSPLRGFLTKANYDLVCAGMRLADGTLWPMPITLDLPVEVAAGLSRSSRLALRDPEGVLLAVLHVEDAWQPDRRAEAAAVFGSTDLAHPGVAHLLRQSHPCYVGGRVEVLAVPEHHDHLQLRHTPAQLREQFARRGWSRVVAFQTRNPMHRAHLELTMRAVEQTEARLLVHPVCGLTKPGDVDYFTRVRCYQAIMRAYPAGTAMLSLLPLAMRMGGPREALWHAIVRKNHGVDHLIVGRDHAGPGADGSGRPFYGPYQAQDLVRRHEGELGMTMLPYRQMVYLPERATYVPEDEIPEGARSLSISGTELRRRLRTGAALPRWFTPPAVADELRRSYPPAGERGLVVLFTGLSGSGKSTIANILQARFLELGGRSVTVLDGDVVRKHLSSELGFSPEHRDLNVRRIGFVAAEVARSGGIAICAPIAPYDQPRQQVRRMVGEAGGDFVLVHVATALETCERRDRKGLYAQARSGQLTGFTGVSDPYQAPTDAEVVIGTDDATPTQSAQQVLAVLEGMGYLGRPAHADAMPDGHLSAHPVPLQRPFAGHDRRDARRVDRRRVIV